jgi:hypothetical protein
MGSIRQLGVGSTLPSNPVVARSNGASQAIVCLERLYAASAHDGYRQDHSNFRKAATWRQTVNEIQSIGSLWGSRSVHWRLPQGNDRIADSPLFMDSFASLENGLQPQFNKRKSSCKCGQGLRNKNPLHCNIMECRRACRRGKVPRSPARFGWRQGIGCSCLGERCYIRSAHDVRARRQR